MDFQKRPLVLAHRGASHMRVDNSRSAFEAAIAPGCDGVELDVRATSDGLLAVTHAATVKGYGAVAEHTFNGLNRALEGELLQLEQALDILEGLTVNIEIKSDPKEIGWVPAELTSRLLAKFLSGYSTKSTYIVSSFSVRALEVFADLAPGFAIGLLANIGSDLIGRCHVATEIGANYILPHHSGVNADIVKEAHALGLGVITWTVDQSERAVDVAKCLVDGIITNRIDVVINALDS